MLKGQTDAEETIETWRRADDKATRHAHDSAADQCTELSDFGVKLRDEIRAADNAVSSLIENQIQRDQPTGQTPGRVTRYVIVKKIDPIKETYSLFICLQ